MLFLIVALATRDEIQNNLFGGSPALYWILVVGVLAYAGSYFARGWLAGHKRFALYGALVFLESTSRFLCALIVAFGLVSKSVGAVGIGMAVAPFVSLTVIPFAFSKVKQPGVPAGVEVADAAARVPASLEESATDLSLKHGSGFAASVVAIMFSEQTLMNAGVLIVAASAGGSITSGLAGFVFNVMLIVRAPLQLFQAIQTSILPHLAGLEANDSNEEFRRAIRITIMAIAVFAGAVALGLLLIGPFVMNALLPNKSGFTYNRFGLAIVGIGMGLHLTAGTLNQALLARGQAKWAAVSWLTAAGAFVLFVATTTTSDASAQVLRVEAGYCGAAGLLALLLWLIYRRGARSPAIAPAAAAIRGPQPMRPERSRRTPRRGPRRRTPPTPRRAGWRRPASRPPPLRRRHRRRPRARPRPAARRASGRACRRSRESSAGCPSRVDAHAEREIERRAGDLDEGAGRCAGAERRAGGAARLANRREHVVEMRRRLDVNRDAVRAGACDVGDLALGLLDHQVHIDDPAGRMDLVGDRTDRDRART